VNVNKTLHELELSSCANQASTELFCQLARGLNQVFDKGPAQSRRFFTMLADIKNHFCERPNMKVQCDALETMLEAAPNEETPKLTPKLKLQAPKNATNPPPSGLMKVDHHDGSVKHSPV